MYDNNGYQPPYNFSTDPNQQYQNYQGQPQPPKKKKTNTGLVVGVIIAAIVFGSASGFGGSYLASRMDGVSPEITVPNTSDGIPEDTSFSSETPEDSITTTAEYVRPETAVDESLSSLENMAAINTTGSYSYKELYKKVNESIVVVNNYVSGSIYGEASEYVLYGTGSGVIFTTDGYIITNYHVINGYSKVSVVVNDKYGDDVEMEATVVGSDSATDLAVLKISRDKEQPFTAAALGDSDSLEIGQDVAAIGNPASLNKSLTRGIISGLNRYSSEKGYVLSSIQTDAAINPGNSGGGLFDMYGNVIGIVNSKLVADDSSIENLGFAITINEAKPVISDLINFGYVTGRPALGISTREIKNQYTAQLYGVGAVGLFVAAIDPDAPVAQSDLQVGDIITAVNGQSVSEVADVQDIIKGMSAGDKVTVTVARTTTTSNGYFGYSYRTTSVEIEIILTESK